MFNLIKKLFFLFSLILVNPIYSQWTNPNGDLTPQEAQEIAIQQSLEEQERIEREKESIENIKLISMLTYEDESKKQNGSKRKFSDLTEDERLEIALRESEETEKYKKFKFSMYDEYDENDYYNTEPIISTSTLENYTNDDLSYNTNSQNEQETENIKPLSMSNYITSALSHLNPFQYFRKNTTEQENEVRTVNFSILESNRCATQLMSADCGFFAILNTLTLANIDLNFNYQESRQLYPEIDSDSPIYYNNDRPNIYNNTSVAEAINKMKQINSISADNLHSKDIEKIIENVDIIALNNLNIVILDANDFILNKGRSIIQLNEFKNQKNPEPIFVILNTNGHWITIKIEKNLNNLNLTIADSAFTNKSIENYMQDRMINTLLIYL